MQYNEFIFDADPKVTGMRNGSAPAWFTDDFWSGNDILYDYIWRNNVGYMEGIAPTFSLDLHGVFMDKNAKKTDLIYMGGLTSGYIISDRLRELWSRFNLPPHRYYATTFQQIDKKNGQIKEIDGYWWFLFEKETGKETIDFSRSSFDATYHLENLNTSENNLKIISYEDYVTIAWTTPPAPKAIRLVFNEKFNQDLDFWGCRFLSGKDYISDKLKNTMEEAKITGFYTRTPEKSRHRARIAKIIYTELEFEQR